MEFFEACIQGIVFSFITCAVFYFVGHALNHLLRYGEFPFSGLIGVAVGLLVVIVPDLFHLFAQWWNDTPQDLWRRPQEGFTSSQIWTLIVWKFFSGVGGGIGAVWLKEQMLPG